MDTVGRAGLTAVAAVGALTLTLTACGDGGAGGVQSAGGRAAGISGTVTYWDTADPKTEGPVYEQLISSFEDKYPDVKVDHVYVAFGDAQSKFSAAAEAGKDVPDVLRIDGGAIPALAAAGAIAPLEGTPALDDAPDFLPGPLDTAVVKDHVYGAPQVTDTLGLLYNKALLKKAGVTKPPQTWSELKAAGRAVKAKTGADGLYLNTGAYFFLPFLYGEGTDWVDADNKKITVTSSKVATAIRTAQDLISSGAAVAPNFADLYGGMQSAFKEGRVAMVINGPWSVPDATSGPAFKNASNLGIAPVPAGGSGAAAAPTGGQNLVVSADSPNAAAAHAFIQFINSAESQAEVAVKNNTMPTRVSAYTAEVKQNSTIAGFQPALQIARARPAVAKGGELYTPFETALGRILQGKVSVQGGMSETARQYQQILTDYTG
ncbi:sugar ABC transporter substrate-binding protein [Actinoplanes campanulatus]|nr:sugar ABC transporter substrate-binding protein [Actinoplanes campanulatus]GID41994.1 sugar ABC transporter substrate-binding protein [Actinoplanes campanulatus]